MSDRPSHWDALRAVPRIAKILGVVLTAAVSLATSAGAFAVWREGLATDGEVDQKIATHSNLPRTPSSPERSAHPAYEQGVTALERTVFAHEQLLREAARARRADTERMVSIEAATLEPSARRRAEAAAFARAQYREALSRGAEPDEAAKQAIDVRPPWRR